MSNSEAERLYRPSGKRLLDPAINMATKSSQAHFRKEIQLGYVVEHDEDEEQHDHDEGYLVHAFLQLLIEVAAERAFDEQEKDGAAIENGEREQVQDAEVEADHGH